VPVLSKFGKKSIVPHLKSEVPLRSNFKEAGTRVVRIVDRSAGGVGSARILGSADPKWHVRGGCGLSADPDCYNVRGCGSSADPKLAEADPPRI